MQGLHRVLRLIFSLGEVCSHVAALLFKVELAVKLGFNKTACTDEACKWNQTYMKKVLNVISLSLNYINN